MSRLKHLSCVEIAGLIPLGFNPNQGEGPFLWGTLFILLDATRRHTPIRPLLRRIVIRFCVPMEFLQRHPICCIEWGPGQFP